MEERYWRRVRLRDETILNVGRGSSDDDSEDSFSTCFQNNESAADTASEEFDRSAGSTDERLICFGGPSY
jgi:hypothetical protein